MIFRKRYCYNNDISAFSPPPIAKQKDLLFGQFLEAQNHYTTIFPPVRVRVRSTRTQYAYAIRVPGTIWLFQFGY